MSGYIRGGEKTRGISKRGKGGGWEGSEWRKSGGRNESEK